MSRKKVPPKAGKAKSKKPRGQGKVSAVDAAKKLLLDGLRIRGEIVPADELGPPPLGGVTHVEMPTGEIKRVAFTTV